MAMIEATCETCGGSFQLDDSLAGRLAKCKRCGSVFTVPEPDPFTRDEDPIPLADEDGRPLPAPSTARDPSGPGAGLTEAPLVLNHTSMPDERAWVTNSERDIVTAPQRSFWADAAMSFIVPFRRASLFVFGFIVMFKAIQAFLGLLAIGTWWIGLLGLFGQLIITGWLCAYYFLVIQSTCTGEDLLPGFEIKGWVAGIIPRGLRYIGTVAWAGVPFLVWSALVFKRTIIPNGGDQVVWVGLLALALFLWPMIVLSAANQGFTVDVLRYDLQLLTIGRSFLSYAAVFAMLSVLVGLSALALGFGTHVGLRGLGSGIALRGVLVVLGAYVDVTTMRLIGLFYRHNKHRFAWLAE